MSVTLTGTGGLFTRLGKIIGGINEACTAVGATANSRADAIAAQFASAQQDLIDGLYANRDSYRGSAGSDLSYLRTLAQNTIIEMCADDGAGINPRDLDAALVKIIAQMVGDVASINQPTVTATVTAGSANVGNGTCIASVLDGTDGLQTDYAFAETIVGTCTDDAYTGGGATEGQEPFQFVGQLPADDDLAWDWPQGSGCDQQAISQNAALTGNLLDDGNFESWSGSPLAPDDWDIGTGTAGSTVVRAASPYIGTYNLTFVGNGSELTCIRQTLTLSDLEPYGVYGWNMLLKTDGSVAAGVLRVRLVDNGNNVISDEAGNANSSTKTISTLTSSYTAFNGFFRLPAQLPSAVKLEIALSTALTNTEVLNIDHVGLVEAQRLYDGGPLVAIFNGSTKFAINDTFSIAVANNLTTTSFARSLDRLFGLRALGRKIPSAASETILDSLIS